MKSISGYLSFNGNCREAMHFYKDCLGGKLQFQTVGESSAAAKMPKKMKDCILHGSLVKNKFVLMGTDLLDTGGLQKGNNISLLVQCSSKAEITTLYKKLAAGGSGTRSLSLSAQGALTGNLVDRYGNHWLLFYKSSKP